ncbi:MAG: hypothetical protein ACRDHS_02615 [Actinomycetota bacterium]
MEGLVGALIGGGVWLAATAILTQVTKFETAASVAVGAGVGLVVVAGFIWRVVLPKRAGEQERINVLKGEARHTLEALIAEGERKWRGVTLAPESSVGRLDWQRRVHSFLLDAFGRQKADEFRAEMHVGIQIQMLNELNRNLDDLQLRSAFRGWGGR